MAIWGYLVVGLLAVVFSSVSSVPRETLLNYVLLGMVVFITAFSIAVLAIYRAERSERMTLVDRLRLMGELPRREIMRLAASQGITVVFAIRMTQFLGEPVSSYPWQKPWAVCGVMGAIYLLGRVSLQKLIRNYDEFASYFNVIRTADRVLLIALSLAGLVLAGIYAAGMFRPVLAPVVLYFAIVAGLLAQPLLMLLRGGRRQAEER